MQNLVSSRSPRSLTRQLLASVSCKAASALWAVSDTPWPGALKTLGPRRASGRSGENFLYLDVNSNTYKELAALGMLLSLNLRNVLGSDTGVPG